MLLEENDSIGTCTNKKSSSNININTINSDSGKKSDIYSSGGGNGSASFSGSYSSSTISTSDGNGSGIGIGRIENLKNDSAAYRNILKMNYDMNQRIQYLALYDICCNITSFVALVTAGSGTYQLVYSSIIIITATFRHFLLPNKKLTFNQWLACLIVTFGLLLSAFGNQRHDTMHHSGNLTTGHGNESTTNSVQSINFAGLYICIYRYKYKI